MSTKIVDFDKDRCLCITNDRPINSFFRKEQIAKAATIKGPEEEGSKNYIRFDIYIINRNKKENLKEIEEICKKRNIPL